MTDMSTRADENQDAVYWAVRINADSLSPHDHEDFAAWLAMDPSRAEAFQGALVFCQDLDRDLVRLSREDNAYSIKRLSLSWRWPIWIAIPAAAALVAVAVLLLPAENRYQTSIGEQREVALSDGSVINLNTGTEISVSFDDQERIVMLRSGEALFDVEPDPDRRFLVTSGDLTVTVVGTRFNIEIADAGTLVSVFEGQVSVSEAGGEQTQLSAGAQLSRFPSGETRIDSFDERRVLLWRQGKVMFDNASLEEVLREFDRYYPGSLELADPTLGSLTLSGIFSVTGRDAIDKTLEGFFPVTIHRSGKDGAEVHRRID